MKDGETVELILRISVRFYFEINWVTLLISDAFVDFTIEIWVTNQRFATLERRKFHEELEKGTSKTANLFAFNIKQLKQLLEDLYTLEIIILLFLYHWY